MKMWKKDGFTIYELIFILAVIAVGVYFLSLAIASGLARAKVANFAQTVKSIDKAARTYIVKERPISTEIATLNLQRLEKLEYLPFQGEDYVLRVVDLRGTTWGFYRPVGSLEYPQGNPAILIAYTGKMSSLFEKYFKRWALENSEKTYLGQVSLPGFTDAVLHFQVPPYEGHAAVVFFPLR